MQLATPLTTYSTVSTSFPLRLAAQRPVGVAILVAVFFAMIYLWQVNSLASAGYVVSDLENQKALLDKQNQHLQIAVAQSQASETILNKLKETDMIKSSIVSYINVNTGVARK